MTIPTKYIQYEDIDTFEKYATSKFNKIGSALPYICNPSIELQKKFVENFPTSIRYIYSPSEKLQLMAIRDNPTLISTVDKPTEKVQLAAITKDPRSIKFSKVRNPSMKVLEEVIKSTDDPVVIKIAFCKYDDPLVAYNKLDETLKLKIELMR